MALVAIRRKLATTITKTLTKPPPPPSLSSSNNHHRFTFSLINTTYAPQPENPIAKTQTRTKSTRSGYSPLNDSSPNWSNRPPKETILLDGCDYEHWLIVMEFSNDPKPSEEEMVNAYVKTLVAVVGSEEEAKKKIYSVCTTTYTGFGALISEELSYKVKGLPGVLWVLPDSYLDVPNKDYGGDLFVDGKVIHRPQYWFNERQPTRNRPRPRYERRRERMQIERREPMHQRQSWDGADHGQPVQQQQQQYTMNGQNPVPSGGGASPPNQGHQQQHYMMNGQNPVPAGGGAYSPNQGHQGN